MIRRKTGGKLIYRVLPRISLFLSVTPTAGAARGLTLAVAVGAADAAAAASEPGVAASVAAAASVVRSLDVPAAVPAVSSGTAQIS